MLAGRTISQASYRSQWCSNAQRRSVPAATTASWVVTASSTTTNNLVSDEDTCLVAGEANGDIWQTANANLAAVVAANL